MNRVNISEIEFTDEYAYRWHDSPFSGLGVETTDDGTLLSEIEIRDGMQHGTTKEFYPSGHVKREANYENNTLNGFVREWDENGLPLLEEEYERGICLRRKAKNAAGKLAPVFELDENDPRFDLLKLIRAAEFSSQKG